MQLFYFSTLFPTPESPHLGAFSFQRVKALRAHGCEVIVISPIGMTPPLHILKSPKLTYKWIKSRIKIQKKTTYKGITVYHPKWIWPPKAIFGWYTSFFLYYQVRKKLSSLSSDYKPNAIISSWLPDVVAACLIGKELHIPVIAIAEGGDINALPELQVGWNKVKKIINELSSKIVFVSNALKSKGLSIGIWEEKSRVIYNGVDTNLFHLHYGNFAKKKFSLLGVGWLEPVKGFSILLEALAKLHMIMGDAMELILIGEGRMRKELENKAKELGIDDLVKFIGAVDQEKLLSYYQTADVLCVPSYSESFGCVVVEAMACGKPVVASAVGGIPEIVDSQSGILVPPGDSNCLCQALLEARERQWDKDAIRRKVELSFTWDKWAESLLSLIDNGLN